MGNVTVDMADVWAVVGQVRNYIIAIVAALVIAIVVIVASSLKLKKPLKGLVNGNAVIAFFLVVVIAANMMLGGPLYNTLNTVLTDSGTLSEETVAATFAFFWPALMRRVDSAVKVI